MRAHSAKAKARNRTCERIHAFSGKRVLVTGADGGIGLAAPISPIAELEEIADIVLFPASEEASYMVGALASADGGVTLQ